MLIYNFVQIFRCEEIIRAIVSTDNVAVLYSTAIKYGARYNLFKKII